MAREQRVEIIKKIEKLRDSKLLCYLTSDRQGASSQIAKDAISILTEHLDRDEYKKIDLLVFTLGGDPLAAFGINRLLREYTEELNALIPDKCHSAGTLFALGCNKIFMTKLSSLGPIDPSINDPLNPAININGHVQTLPLSVESVAGFKGLVKDDWGIKKGKDLALILKILTEKVHPLALGRVYRIRQQIEFLATTLLKQHRSDKRRITHIVQKLTKELGSHDYLIYRREARELLGDQVAIAEELGKLIRDLHKDFAQEMDLGKPFDPGIIISNVPHKRNEQGQPTLRQADASLILAAIESAEKGHKFIEKKIIREVPVNRVGITEIALQQQVILREWQGC